MVRKSGCRFSEKTMLNARSPAGAPSPAGKIVVFRAGKHCPAAFTLPISPVISMTSGALVPEDAGGPMVVMGGYRGLPLALAAAVGLLTAASAQQATQPAATETPSKQAKPKSSGTKAAAPKSDQKSEQK